MKTATVKFSMELFEVLNLEYDEHAKSRDLLNGIFSEEESVETVLQDTIYSMRIYLLHVREAMMAKGIPFGEHPMVPFVEMENGGYQFKVGNDKCHRDVFSVIPHVDQGFVFGKNVKEGVQVCYLEDLDRLKGMILFWCNDFYTRLKEYNE